MTSLIEELKLREAPRPTAEVFLSLLVTANRLHSTHTELLASFGITLKQYNVLRIVRGAGNTGLPLMDIGKRTIERSPDISRIVNRMVKQGWLKRTVSSEDKRVANVTIADTGSELLSKMNTSVEADVERLLHDLNEQEVKQLSGLLERVRSSIYTATESE